MRVGFGEIAFGICAKSIYDLIETSASLTIVKRLMATTDEVHQGEQIDELKARAPADRAPRLPGMEVLMSQRAVLAKLDKSLPGSDNCPICWCPHLLSIVQFVV